MGAGGGDPNRDQEEENPMGGETPNETRGRRPQWGQGGTPMETGGEETPKETQIGTRRRRTRWGGGDPDGDPNRDRGEETPKETGGRRTRWGPWGDPK